MGALEAAIERVGGEAGAAARDAAARGHAGEALPRLIAALATGSRDAREKAMGALEAAIEHRFAGTTRAAATLNAS